MNIDPDLCASLSNEDVVEGVRVSLRNEAHGTADTICFLAELDRRDLYRSGVCTNLVEYCVNVLGMGYDEAYNRADVA